MADLPGRVVDPVGNRHRRAGRLARGAAAAKNGATPPANAGPVLALHGRLIDATGAPIAGATLVGIYEARTLRSFVGPETVTNAHGEFRGEFQLPPSPSAAPAAGDRVRLIGRLRDGAEFEIGFVVTDDGAVTLKLPIDVEAPGGMVGPREAGRGELAGRVVDAEGKPIEGAEVDAWIFSPVTRQRPMRRFFSASRGSTSSNRIRRSRLSFARRDTRRNSSWLSRRGSRAG
jgi:hypothetical protein